MTDAINYKLCPACKIEKPTSDYYVQRTPSGRDKLAHRCKTCSKKVSGEWGRKNRSYLREYERRRRIEAPRGLESMSAKDIERFRSKYKQADPDTCWEWQAHRDEDGYGDLKIKRITYRAHRVAYFLHHGSIPDDLLVCHTCDNPPCVNPAHLFVGDALVNNRDKVRKGRAATGERNGRYTHPETSARGERVNTAQLTESDVIEILAALKAGAGLTELGQRYGVCKQAIYVIREGRTWKHIPRP